MGIFLTFVKYRRKILSAGIKYFLLFLIFICVLCLSWDQPSYYKDFDIKVQSTKSRPWYFERGSICPNYQYSDALKLWPNEAIGDRILDQLMFIPPLGPKSIKKIYVRKLQQSIIYNGSKIFNELNCPVKHCEIVDSDGDADAVIFEDFVTKVRDKSSLNQLWILHLLESPFFTGKVIQQTSVNWTATYRLDSDLVTPYDKWAYFNDSIKTGKLIKNYAFGKTKKVAWFVSNCRSKNKRLEYARSLKKYIPVDIYGPCGNKICLRIFEESCKEMISKHYKFYLSFENANCRDYITEKFFTYGLRLDVIPIVMGAPKKDYEKVAPRNSFIHVEDFQSPKELANYLHYLDENDEAYNSYFLWKSTGEFINTYFMCRLCAMLHANRPNHYYQKVMHWWNRKGICTKTFWNKTNGHIILKNLKKDLKKTTKWLYQ